MASWKTRAKIVAPYAYMILAQIIAASYSILSAIVFTQGTNTIVFNIYQFTAATIFMGPLAFFIERKARPPLSLSILCWMFLLALLGATLFQNLFSASLNYISSTTQSAILNLFPAFTYLLSIASRQEAPELKRLRGIGKLSGTLLSVSGAFTMIFWHGKAIKTVVAGSSGNWVVGYILATLGILSLSSWLVLQESLNTKLNRSKVENSWFVFGVSYPGALSAWFRLKFPHLTCGSLASSAVVLSVYNFTEFDKQVGESAGPECKAALQEVTALVDEQLVSNAEAVKNLFGAAKLQNDGDFLYLLADAAVTAFQYGNPDTLCSPLINAKKSGKNLVDEYASYIKDHYLGDSHEVIQTYDREHLKRTDISGSDRLWWFQVCTEVAYFQVAPANDSVRSPKIDARYHLDLCKYIFGEGIYPDVEATNIYYGGTKIAGSKIIFTNGSQDPWRHASKQTSSPEMPSYIISCHNCGHGSDLRGCPQSPLNIEGNPKSCTSPDAVVKVRQQIVQHMDLWLSQCQGAGSSYN